MLTSVVSCVHIRCGPLSMGQFLLMLVEVFFFFRFLFREQSLVPPGLWTPVLVINS